MEENPILFDTITEAIKYAFQHDEKSVLSLDRIFEILSQPNLYIRQKYQEQTELRSVITRRRISSTLSSSEIFVKSGSQRTSMWALRPNNPMVVSDGTITNSIETVLVSNGPSTVEQIAKLCSGGLNEGVFRAYLESHSNNYKADENGLLWFAGQPRPIKREFGNVYQALLHAFTIFKDGASIEELHWYLCLCTVGNGKPIKRRCISRELSRRQDLFIRLSRARYTAVHAQKNLPRPSSCPQPLLFDQNATSFLSIDQNFDTQYQDEFIEAPIMDDDDQFVPINFFSCTSPFQFM